MNTTFIYALCDPRDSDIKYIGKSNDPKLRYKHHINHLNENSKKTNWIKSLKNKDLLPELLIIDEVPENEWAFFEMHYISLFKSWGFDLKNGTDGGDTSYIKRGAGYKFSAELKKKLSDAHKGVKLKPHHVAGLKKARQTSKSGRKERPVIREDGVEYHSLAEAARQNNILSTSLRANLRGLTKTCGGFKWEYKK